MRDILKEAGIIIKPFQIISPSEAIQTLDVEGVLNSTSLNNKFKKYPLTYVFDRIPNALICFSP